MIQHDHWPDVKDLFLRVSILDPDSRESILAEEDARHPATAASVRELLMVARVLLADVAQRIARALAIELVDRDEVGEVEHVDFL